MPGEEGPGKAEMSPNEILAQFDRLKQPLEAIAKVNPGVAKAMADACERVVREMLARLNQVNADESVQIRRLSEQAKQQMCEALGNVKIELP